MAVAYPFLVLEPSPYHARRLTLSDSRVKDKWDAGGLSYLRGFTNKDTDLLAFHHQNARVHQLARFFFIQSSEAQLQYLN